MPEKTEVSRKKLLEERESFNLKDHLQSLKNAPKAAAPVAPKEAEASESENDSAAG